LLDDFEPWRRLVSSLIAPRKPEWSIVCEVSDGVEAVEKVGDLRPELILLDIGLPSSMASKPLDKSAKLPPTQRSSS